MSCCLCGTVANNVKWCSICHHYFCSVCRWQLWGKEGRAVAAVKQWLTGHPPPYCNHEGEAA